VGFSGGSGGAGGYRFQALAAAYVYAHALAEHSLNWVSGEAIPLAVSAETAGPGDDLRVEYSGGSGAASGDLEVQAKRGLRMGSELWDALLSLARGLDENSSLHCALLVDHAASRSVKDELPRDIERLAQGRSDRLRPITCEFLRRLEAEGITPGRSLLMRLSVVVADLGDQSEGEGAALVLLSKVVDKASILNAWTAFREDGMRVAEIAGRRDVPALWDMLEAHGIRAAGGEPLLSQRQDQVPPYPYPFVGRDAVVSEISTLLSAAGDGSRFRQDDRGHGGSRGIKVHFPRRCSMGLGRAESKSALCPGRLGASPWGARSRGLPGRRRCFGPNEGCATRQQNTARPRRHLGS
jgi:hypothetical protein